MTLAKNAKTIREALKNNCLCVYHDRGGGPMSRVIDVRTKGGKLQVRHLSSGAWRTVTEESTVIQG